jgi:hypothetical protein
MAFCRHWEQEVWRPLMHVTQNQNTELAVRKSRRRIERGP